jgi:DNA polymerase-1|tara:strand:+ start:557 stop:1639 length:1083 start_codon:yes stop_codon:yes gene_type:complete
MMSDQEKNEKYLSILKQIQQDDLSSATSTLNVNSRVLIIDGLNYFIRAFSASPAVNDDGIHIGGIIGFLKSLRFTLASIKPTRCIIVFDGKGSAKNRRKIYPHYKNKRKVRHRFNRNATLATTAQTEDKAIKMQLSRLVNYLEQLPLTLISIDGLEADDIIAYIVSNYLVNSQTIIASSDRDFYQLIDDRVTVWSPAKKKEYKVNNVLEEFGIPPHNFLTYKILEGDKSDNIPGIRGAGLKTIKKFIEPITTAESFDIKELLAFANSSKSKIKLIKHIRENFVLLKRNYLLMQLQNVDISNHKKLYIQEAVEKKMSQLVKYKFLTMFIQDKLWSHIPDMDSWIVEFIRLDRFRGLQNGNK